MLCGWESGGEKRVRGAVRGGHLNECDAAVWQDRAALDDGLDHNVLAVDLDAVVVKRGLEQHIQT